MTRIDPDFGAQRRPISTPRPRLHLALLAGMLVLLPALPAAAVDQPDRNELGDATTTSTTMFPEDQETISSLRPEPAEPPDADPSPGGVVPIVFPLESGGTFTASFGAPRDGGSRTHKGIDIFAEKLTPVVAAREGVVILVRGTVGGDCCAIRLRHPDGAETLYLHLNNDTPGTDDGLGFGIAEGLVVGDQVAAGQVIGFVGDSGNAEETPAHLHFEYHDPSGAVLDPYPILTAAQGGGTAAYASLQEIPTELAFTGVSTLFLASVGFVLVIGGILMLSFARCDDLWDDRPPDVEAGHHPERRQLVHV